jgi:hypothetical protein
MTSAADFGGWRTYAAGLGFSPAEAEAYIES